MVETFGPFIRDYIGKYLIRLYPTTKKIFVNMNKGCCTFFVTMLKKRGWNILFSVIFSRKKFLFGETVRFASSFVKIYKKKGKCHFSFGMKTGKK